MSVRVKNIPAQIKKPDSSNVEEFLVERYESLALKTNLLESISRWVYVSILFLGFIFTFIYKNAQISEFYFFIPHLIASITYSVVLLGTRSNRFNLQEKISNLEREIIKVQMEKDFRNDERLRSKFEDFYIRFYLLRRKSHYSSNLIMAEVIIYSVLYSIGIITIRAVSK